MQEPVTFPTPIEPIPFGSPTEPTTAHVIETSQRKRPRSADGAGSDSGGAAKPSRSPSRDGRRAEGSDARRRARRRSDDATTGRPVQAVAHGRNSDFLATNDRPRPPPLAIGASASGDDVPLLQTPPPRAPQRDSRSGFSAAQVSAADRAWASMVVGSKGGATTASRAATANATAATNNNGSSSGNRRLGTPIAGVDPRAAAGTGGGFTAFRAPLRVAAGAAGQLGLTPPPTLPGLGLARRPTTAAESTALALGLAATAVPTSPRLALPPSAPSATSAQPTTAVGGAASGRAFHAAAARGASHAFPSSASLVGLSVLTVPFAVRRDNFGQCPAAPRLLGSSTRYTRPPWMFPAVPAVTIPSAAPEGRAPAAARRAGIAAAAARVEHVLDMAWLDRQYSAREATADEPAGAPGVAALPTLDALFRDAGWGHAASSVAEPGPAR